MFKLEEAVLKLDEFEAVRLSDVEGLEQEAAAEKMAVSRQTFGNILASARRKIADAIVHGKALKIEGGVVQTAERYFVCYDCKNEWIEPHGSGRPLKCSKCGSVNLHRASQDKKFARAGFGQGKRKCWGWGQSR